MGKRSSLLRKIDYYGENNNNIAPWTRTKAVKLFYWVTSGKLERMDLKDLSSLSAIGYGYIWDHTL
jgi:hypothetical protein